MKETLREVISRGRWGQGRVGAFPAPHLDAHLAWPSARQARPLQPSSPASFSQRTPSPRNWPHPGHPTPTTPHGKINFLERRFGHSPFAKPSTLDLGHYNHLLQGRVGGGRGHSHCRDGSPGFSQHPLPPLQIPPNHWQQPKKQFLQFPPTAHY